MHTIHELTEQLLPSITPSVQKDVKTAVRILTQALGYSDPKTCPLDACFHPLAKLQHHAEAWIRQVDATLTARGKTPKTTFKVRNVRTNLARLFGLTEAQGLFSLLPPVLELHVPLSQQHHRAQGIYRGVTHRDGHYLPRRYWPPAVESAFASFEQWATAPMVENRRAAWKKRPSTLAYYEQLCNNYFGYLHNCLHIHPVSFDHLFNFTLIERFVHWHINEKFKRTTHTIQKFVEFTLTLVRQYCPDPVLAAQVLELLRRIGKPLPVYHKDDVWLPLREIDRIGSAFWPTQSLHEMQVHAGYQEPNTGRVVANCAGIALMLRLWVWIPLRPRNMREMTLSRNLIKKEGTWFIQFRGSVHKMRLGSKWHEQRFSGCKGASGQGRNLRTSARCSSG